MPPAGKLGGRNRGRGGGGDGGRQQAQDGKSNGGNGGSEFPRRGAGRGIPDFKENPRSGAKGSGSSPSQVEGEEGSTLKFNAQEASDWMSSRYKAVVEEYEKQKASGKKGEIQDFSKDISQPQGWGSRGPVIPPREDFLQQLQMALQPFRARQSDEKGGEKGWS
mmetsp:Transcript_101450/g.160415  ORF Transcript_101450/g.160415 Transcript_101450/m.160415 type:complete len:164 (+) Transcript_101450:64-555(+)